MKSKLDGKDGKTRFEVLANLARYYILFVSQYSSFSLFSYIH